MELKFDPKDPKYSYITTVDAANEALTLLEKEKVVAVDIESNSLSPFEGMLVSVQISTDVFAYIFDARKIDLKTVPRFKEFLENKSIIKILHNGKFDYKFMSALLGIKTENIFDTMLAEGILNAGLGGGYYKLTDLVNKYTGTIMEKETRKSFETTTKGSELSEAQLKYAALDPLYTFPIFEQQLEKLRTENLINIAKLEFATTRVVGDMELTGIFINKEKWKGIINNLKVKRNEYAAKFQEAIKPYYAAAAIDLFGVQSDFINVNSNSQLMDLFNNRLKLNIPSTGDAILSNVTHPIAQILRDYRGYEKLVSAFGDTLLEKINKKTGRLHPEFNQMGTATGRFSCNNPNLQQIPRNSPEAPFRECFNPKPGYKLVVADYSAFEMRILAELSGDEKMIKAINDGLDIHSYTAALMFGKPYSDDFKKKFPELRQIAKPIGFGLMYGMGPSRLANGLTMEMGRPVSKEEGTDYINKYFASYPSVKAFLERTSKQAVRNGWSITPAGRKRWYKKPEAGDPEFDKRIGQIEREAKNHPIQGTNADAVKYALVFISERLRKEGIDGAITHTVHDEIVTEIREDQAEAWSKIQSEEMVRAGKLFIKKVAVVSDPFIGDVWEH
jgi:DNA polymerase-1